MRKSLLFFAMLLMSIGVALAQQRVVKGTVYEKKTGQPAIQAVVVVDGQKTIGTATDFDGKFTLKVPENAKSLVVSYTGFKTQKVAIKSGDIKVYLLEEAEVLEDVVVMGYGTGRKVGSVVSNVAVVKAKDLQNKPTANPFDAMAGKVAGVAVASSSGEPGQVAAVSVHGNGSLSLGSAPLYVLDGMPVSSSVIRSLNPSDFESYQFLKDAAATSIYGARAANGVIFITTKRGKTGEKANVTFRSSYGVSNLANRSYYTDKMMSSEDFIAFEEEYEGWKQGLGWKDYIYRQKNNVAPNVQLPVGWDKSVSDSEYGTWREAYVKDRYYRRVYEKGADPRTAQPIDYVLDNTNWADYFFMKNRPTYTADVSVSGGAGRTTYFLSASTFYQKGLRADSRYKKNSVRLNLRTQINKYITIGTNNSVSMDDRLFSAGIGEFWLSGGLCYMFHPYKSSKDAYGEEITEKIESINQTVPTYNLNKVPKSFETLFLNTSSFIEVKPIKGMTLRSQIGYQVNDDYNIMNRMPSHFDAPGNGWAKSEFFRSKNLTNTNTFEYKFSIGENHNFIALLGHEYTNSHYRGFWAYGEGLEDDGLTKLSHATKEKKIGESESAYAFLSGFTRLSYDYADKYFMDVTYRLDGSSRFGSKNRYGHFWSLGTMWNAKKEGFLKDVDWLSNARLRFSIGTQGNASIDNYESYATVGKSGQYNGGLGLAISTAGNPDLRWERQTKMTLGLDLSFFNKLDLELAFYNRITSDMLMSVPYPGYSGFGNIRGNVGEYQNRGVDLKLNYNIYRNKAGDGVSMFVSANYNQDKVLKLFNGEKMYIQQNKGLAYVVGQPVMFFYPIAKGVNPNTGNPEWYLPGEDKSVVTKDDTKVTTTMSDKLTQNTGIRRFIPFQGGFGLNAEFKGFYLESSFVFALGKNMINNDLYFIQNPAKFKGMLNQSKNVKDYWKQKGDNARYASKFVNDANGDPVRDANGNPILRQETTFFDTNLISNSSYLRMKNVTFGYNLPKMFLNKYANGVVSGAKFYVTGRNLLTVTAFDGPDPEPDRNLVASVSPNTTQVSFGLELNF